MSLWGEIAKNRTVQWDRPVNQTGYLEEIAAYWDRVGKGESMESVVKDLGRRVWTS